MQDFDIKTFSPEKFQFLSGGGEMGELIRTKDWSKNPLGTAKDWPQSLRTTISIILNSKFPMFLWWGPQLICFYNDAYRPSLGNNGKHPGILGVPAQEAWPEIWDIIQPLIVEVLESGKATWSEDQLIPIYRNGKIETVYWTFSYSPVNDESGKPAGVFVTCTETTEKVLNFMELAESKNQLQFAIDSAGLATWDIDPATNKFTGNNTLKEWHGLPAGEEFNLEKGLSVVIEQDRGPLKKAIEKAMDFSSGGNFDHEYTIIHPATTQLRIVRAKGKTTFAPDKTPMRLNGILMDITTQAIARRKVEESEQRFQAAIAAVNGILWTNNPEGEMKGEQPEWAMLTGQTYDEYQGYGWAKAVHPDDAQPTINAWKEAVKEKKVFIFEHRVLMKAGVWGYFHVRAIPLVNADGSVREWVGIHTDITDKRKSELALQQSERNLRLTIMQASVAIAILRGNNYVVEIVNDRALALWGREKDEVMNKPILESMPELALQGIKDLLDDVYINGNTFSATELPVQMLRKGTIETAYVNFVYEPLYDTEGKINGIMAVGTEVTEQITARQKVENAEERLRLALEAAELSIWDLDLRTRDIIHSPRLAEIFGHDKSKILTHKDMRSQIHPDDIHGIVEKAFDAAIITGKYKYEARIVRPDNKICWIRVQGKVFYDEQNKPIKIIGTLRDITDEKQRQRELEESEQKFRLLAESMPQFIWTGNAEGNLNYFNQSVYNYSGMSREEINDGGWIKIVHPDDREENIKAWINSITTGKDFLFEHRFRRHDGEYRWQLSRAVPQKDETGKIQMWVGTSTDIQQMKEQDQQKDYFISLASHELKTPITSIKAYTQILLSTYINSGDAFLIKSLNVVDKQVLKLTNLISDLLDLSKIRSGSLTLHKENFPVNELIQEVTDEIKHINPEYDIIYSKEANTLLNGDRERIGQVIINFLTNAIKYSPDSRKIKVESLIENNNLLITVEDYGIGINKKDQEKIFERFYRVEGKNEKTFPGFGIGLFISQEIIRRHNGDIGVKSEPGKGSVFYFSIPIVQ